MEHHIANELEVTMNNSRGNVPKELLVTPSLSILFFNSLEDWMIIIACYTALYFLPTYCYFPIILIVAGRFHSFGVILHDLTHMPLKNKTLQIRLIEILAGYPVGSTVNAMRYHHLRHHKDTCMATDPYFKPAASNNSIVKFMYAVRAIILIPFWSIRGIFGSMAFYMKSMRNGYGRVFLQDKSGSDLSESKEIVQCAGEDRWQLAFHGFAFTVLYFLVGAKSIAVYYIVPIGITGIFSGYRLMIEHKHELLTDRKTGTIITHTTDHHLSGILKPFIAPRNIGFHIVHHLHPKVAWYHLPKLRNWYLKNHPNLFDSNKEKNIAPSDN